MAAGDLDRVMHLLAKLPGLGPRSARRGVLHLMQRRESLMLPLAEALAAAARSIRTCRTCGNFDTTDPCAICQDVRRDPGLICVVEDVGDVWALERAAAFKGRYHVIGGVLSALDGVGPEDLNIESLVARADTAEVTEVVLAMNATVDGQTTAHYIADRLAGAHVAVSRLAHGVPVGGELDYLDDGTLTQAMKARQSV
ncbi:MULTISPECIES: recombination mediator RecR [Thalassobaculum]|uniref:Recombination protein RecR n=2 Tax=Thalassobaculum TaxID=526215 RepID=A0A8G2EW07_9PROT|nr:MULTISPECIES: recombination mediator RecR [Thalassobaculum]SDG08193.1 DNA replication and repair protein RecR [Thalassobaculum litoreum DSM 18839]